MRVSRWVVPVVLAAACTSSPLTDADRSELSASEQRVRASVLAADWASLSELYADSAVLMPPDAPPVTGRNAILSRFGTRALTINTFETTAHEIGGTRAVAYVRGTYLLTAAAFGSDHLSTEVGKYVRVWQRHPGGWRIVADIWNANNAALTALGPVEAGDAASDDTAGGAP